MYKYVFVLTLLVFKVNSVSICDSNCVCGYNTKSNQDLHGENVDCSYNPEVLKSNFSLPTTVYALDLSANNLTRIEQSTLLRSKTMIQLLINNNEITEIETNAFDLPELKRLDLSDNKLTIIYEETFKNIRKLEYLNLANNLFTTFTKLTFHHLGNLNEIVLDNNKIGPTLRKTNLFDRNGYGLTQKVKSISISGIQLNVVPENFFVDAYDLKKVIISNNNLTDTFEIPYTLQYLDLSDNPIKDISMEDFVDLPGLNDLKLNNLQIKEIPDYVFSPLRGLVSLEIERNKNLTRFSTLAFGQEVLNDPDDFLLEKLSLKGSRLTMLDEELLEPLGRLMILDLQGNPWRCDCKLTWLKKLQIQPNDYDHLRCGSPKPLFNSRIFDLDAKFFMCRVDRRSVGFTLAVIAFSVSLTSIAVWLFFCLPRSQSRCRFVQNVFAQSAAYTVLPVSAARDPF